MKFKLARGLPCLERGSEVGDPGPSTSWRKVTSSSRVDCLLFDFRLEREEDSSASRFC